MILSPNTKKTNRRQTTVDFGGEVIKFCFRIKIFVQILEKEVLFCKILDDDIEHWKNTQKPCKKTNKIIKLITVSNIKYEPFREINKI